MDKETQLGMNRTGVKTSPIQSKKMLQDPPPNAPFTPGDPHAADDVRIAYIKAAGPVGSVPPPPTAKGVAKSALQALTGKRAQVLIDRLGERLAFERTGTRLYEAMMTKCRAAADGNAAAVLQQLEHNCREEAEHFKLLFGCLEQLGADPTVQTPCADVAGVEAGGLLQVVTDPKTSVTQSLHAILVAELADNDGWDELIRLGQEFKQDEMTKKFEKARDEERQHLEGIRRMHEQSTLREAELIS